MRIITRHFIVEAALGPVNTKPKSVFFCAAFRLSAFAFAYLARQTAQKQPCLAACPDGQTGETGLKNEIKNFLKPTISDASIRVFRWFHFDLKVKNQNFIAFLSRNCEKAIPTSPKER